MTPFLIPCHSLLAELPGMKRDTTCVGSQTQFFHQDYVMQLASVRKDALEQADIGLVVIGCGEWQAIEDYEGNFAPRSLLRSVTRFPYRYHRVSRLHLC